MNPFELALQIKKALQEVAWPGGDAEVVFGTQKGVVAVFAGAPGEEQFPRVFPCCLVVMGDGDPDEDEPDLIEHTFRLITGVMAPGDEMGEQSIIGGPLTNIGQSDNRGIGEVSELVRQAVGDLTGADGAAIQVVSTAIDTPFHVGRLRHVVFDETTVTALCTSALHYASPQEIAVLGSSFTWAGGDLTGTGHCAGRFDFKQYRVFESAAVLTAPSGTLKYTGTLASATITTTASKFYTAFADYNPRDVTGSIIGTSDVIIGSYLQVPA